MIHLNEQRCSFVRSGLAEGQQLPDDFEPVVLIRLLNELKRLRKG